VQKFYNQVPFGLAVGNRDQAACTANGNGLHGQTALYNTSFPDSEWESRPWWELEPWWQDAPLIGVPDSLVTRDGEYSEEGGTGSDSRYLVFDYKGRPYIVLLLEWVETDESDWDRNLLHWADRKLKQHAGHVGIVVRHQLISNDTLDVTESEWTDQGKRTYNALRNNKNLRMMLCGHEGEDGIRRERSRFDGRDQEVTIFLADYTDDSDPLLRRSALRNYHFSVETDCIFVETIRTSDGAVISGDYNSGSDAGTQAFRFVGSTAPVVGVATVTFPLLRRGHSYEWYAVAVKSAGLRTPDVGMFPVQGRRFTVPLAVGFEEATAGESKTLDLATSRTRQGTMVTYTVPATGPVHLAVYDVLGRRITVLRNGVDARGRYTTHWSGETDYGRASSGVYFVRLRVGDGIAAGKILVVR
jgi:hypothetical protein